jgi:hypothetical protein
VSWGACLVHIQHVLHVPRSSDGGVWPVGDVMVATWRQRRIDKCRPLDRRDGGVEEH